MQGNVIHYYRDGSSFHKILRWASIENNYLTIREEKNLPILERISLGGISLESYHDKAVNEHWINIHKPDLSVFYMILKDKPSFDAWFKALEMASKRRNEEIGSVYATETIKSNFPNDTTSMLRPPELPPRSRSVSRNSSTFRDDVSYNQDNINNNSTRNLKTIRENNQMPKSQVLKTDNIGDIRRRYPVSGLAKRMSISASDFVGKSRDDLIILLLQLNREKANLSRWKEYFENEMNKVNSDPEKDPNEKKKDLQQYRKELEDVNGQLRLTKPLVSFLEKITTLGDMYAGDDTMFASEYKKHLLDPREYVPTKKNIDFIRKIEECEMNQYIKERIKPKNESLAEKLFNPRNIKTEEIAEYKDRRVQLEKELEKLVLLLSDNHRRREDLVPLFKSTRPLKKYSTLNEARPYELSRDMKHRTIPSNHMYRSSPMVSHEMDSRSERNYNQRNHEVTSYHHSNAHSNKSSGTTTPTNRRRDIMEDRYVGQNTRMNLSRHVPTPDPLMTKSFDTLSSMRQLYAEPWDGKKKTFQDDLTSIKSESSIHEVIKVRNPNAEQFGQSAHPFDQTSTKRPVQEKLADILKDMSPLKTSSSPSTRSSVNNLRLEDLEENIEERRVDRNPHRKTYSTLGDGRSRDEPLANNDTSVQSKSFRYTKNTKPFINNQTDTRIPILKNRIDVSHSNPNIALEASSNRATRNPPSTRIYERPIGQADMSDLEEMKEIQSSKSDQIRKNLLKMNSPTDLLRYPALYRIELDNKNTFNNFKIIDERLHLLELRRKIAFEAAQSGRKNYVERNLKLNRSPLPKSVRLH